MSSNHYVWRPQFTRLGVTILDLASHRKEKTLSPLRLSGRWSDVVPGLLDGGPFRIPQASSISCPQMCPDKFTIFQYLDLPSASQKWEMWPKGLVGQAQWYAISYDESTHAQPQPNKGQPTVLFENITTRLNTISYSRAPDGRRTRE
jgi:hypothetical protein